MMKGLMLTISSCQNQESELSGGEDIGGPFFIIFEFNIESGGDNTAFVDSSDQFDHDLVGTVIIDDFEFTNVSVFLHHSKEFHDNLRNGLNDNLFFTRLFSIDNGL